MRHAAEFVRRHHRHHRPSVSGLFAVACSTITPTVGEVKGRSWHCASRPRVDRHPTQNKIRWEMSA